MRNRLTGIRELRSLLETYNSFHDGFIRAFRTTSKDFFDEAVPPGKVAAGEFEVELEFSHHNFKGSEGKPHSIGLLLLGVEETSIAFRKDSSSFSDWSVDKVEIAPVAGADTFLLSVVSSRHKEGKWTPETICTVRFRAAEFTAPVLEQQGH
ncbi:MAG: hypothetical protein HYV15_04115 [Elusimicrobia bacterium]|nr:hypothetical protein [Elusimicrobiota bacterium]